MTVRHGVTFLRESLWQQNVGRYTTQMYGHRSGAGAMIVPTLVALFPWVGLLPQALIRVSTKNGGGRDILRTTMCVGAVVAFAFYSLSSSKLPSYALMLAPPLGVLIGLWLDDELDHAVPIRTVWMQTAILLGVVAMALMSAPLWAGHLLTARQLFGGMRPEQSDLRALLAPITLPLGCLVAAAAASVLAFRRPRRRILVVATLGASIPVLALLWAQPVLRSMYPWEVLGPEVQKDHGRLWLVGRRAPSLSFYARRSISTVSNEESLDGLVAHEREGWLVLTQEDWARFAATDAARRAHATLVDARGRMVLVRFKG
jgi:4-amino-4-deoxy-L-arabinose transferase-like glycosyltransferase